MAYTPNGSEDSREAYPIRYHESWGRLHPLYLDDAFYCRHFCDRPKLLCSAEYGQTYPLEEIRKWNQASDLFLDLSGRELLAVIVL